MSSNHKRQSNTGVARKKHELQEGSVYNSKGSTLSKDRSRMSETKRAPHAAASSSRCSANSSYGPHHARSSRRSEASPQTSNASHLIRCSDRSEEDETGWAPDRLGGWEGLNRLHGDIQRRQEIGPLRPNVVFLNLEWNEYHKKFVRECRPGDDSGLSSRDLGNDTSAREIDRWRTDVKDWDNETVSPADSISQISDHCPGGSDRTLRAPLRQQRLLQAPTQQLLLPAPMYHERTEYTRVRRKARDPLPADSDYGSHSKTSHRSHRSRQAKDSRDSYDDFPSRSTRSHNETPSSEQPSASDFSQRRNSLEGGRGSIYGRRPIRKARYVDEDE